MRDLEVRPRGRGLGLLLLGACTLWLVVQNTLLAAALLWKDPHRTLAIANALIKAMGDVATGFWSSPAAALLVVGAILVALVVTPAVLRRPVRQEVRHG